MDIFRILARLMDKDCCRIATVTVMAKNAQLTDIGGKKARLCRYQTPYNGSTTDELA